ncbi:hypothetical protein JOC85_000258 [Bacillus mesophilus]|uniref:Uncharacterized protein n=1 Tax=Bacillus mesophilus TaxID=1808955 RepID=A0A6M0Q2H6_9BACI|nr:hypothetical protein [Bacillus mesophilus]MBM7659491.1 hypothetical protein [Bacillus mesophilus]NEY70364.1 hypothetical protein [Bacillus mesophilus]
MVAAVVIPLLFLYFLVITIKDRRQKYEDYLNLDTIKEEAFISGKVLQIDTKTRAFVGKHYVNIVTILLHNKEHQAYQKAIRTSTTSIEPQVFTEGTEVICYGYWEKDVFIFNRFRVKA